MSIKFSEFARDYVVNKDFYFTAMKIPEGKLTLRCSSIGALRDGKVIGPCPLLTAYRVLNINPTPLFNTSMIFAEGRLNEVFWQDALRFNAVNFKYEPVKLNYDFGVFNLTGTPDILVYDKDGNPVYGLELKCVSSDKTTLTVATAAKEEHAIQAGLYSFILGIPFNVIYTKFFIDTVEPSFFEYVVETRRIESLDDFAICSQGHGTLCTIEDVYNYGLVVNNLIAEVFDSVPTYEVSASVPESFECPSCTYCPFKAVCNKRSLSHEVLVVAYELPKFLFKFFINQKAPLELSDGFKVNDKSPVAAAKIFQHEPEGDYQTKLDLEIFYHGKMIGVMKTNSLVFFNGLFKFQKNKFMFDKFKTFHERAVRSHAHAQPQNEPQQDCSATQTQQPSTPQ